MSRKGMSTVLMVVVTAVVLLMTALTLMFITQGGLSSFTGTASARGNVGTCLGRRDAKCASGVGTWNPSGFTVQGTNCSTILEQNGVITSGQTWDCNKEKWS